MAVTNAAALPLHKTKHQDGGTDEISVAALSGELADRQPSKAGTSVLGWTDEKLLKGAGAGLAPDEIDVPSATGNAILQKLQQHLGVWWFNNHWLPTGMISNTVWLTGSVAWYSNYILLSTGATINSYAYINKVASGFSSGASWTKKRFFGGYVAISDLTQYIHFVSGAVQDETTIANTYCHAGFKIINSTLYGTVADGTTEVTLNLGAIQGGGGYLRLECILTPGSECRFYVNGVDKGALATNLPIDAGGQAGNMLWASVYNTAAADKQLYIFESRTFQEE